MKNFLVACLVSVLLSTPAVEAQSRAEGSIPSGITQHENLVYSDANGGLKLNLFLPQTTTRQVPCIIVIQGGGFLPQDGKRFLPFAVYLAENGFAAALISYRGRPDYRYLETIGDVKAAVRYVRKISGRYNIDPEMIGAMGRSAGGTLAAMLAVTCGMPEFEGDGGHPGFSSCIQAGVGYAGVYDFVGRFTDREQLALQPRFKTKIETNGEWIGDAFSPTNRHWLQASAINHVDASDAPMLLMHCKDDSTVPWLQSENLYLKLRDAGTRSEIEYYETGGHGFRTDDPAGPMDRMVDFFRRTLGR